MSLEFLGCQQKPYQLDFIIPDGFRGFIVIVPDDPDGELLTERNGRILLRFPKSGVFRMRGADPFRSYLYSATFANGERIWVQTHIDDHPTPGQIGLFGGHTHIEEKNGTPSVSYRYFIGIESQWKASAQ